MRVPIMERRQEAGGSWDVLRRDTKSLSRMTYSWNQKGLVTASATCSMDRIDMVDTAGDDRAQASRSIWLEGRF